MQAATGLQSILLLSHWTQSGPEVHVLEPEQETPKGGAWHDWLAVQFAESEVAPKATKSNEKAKIPNTLRMTHLPRSARLDAKRARDYGFVKSPTPSTRVGTEEPSLRDRREDPDDLQAEVDAGLQPRDRSRIAPPGRREAVATVEQGGRARVEMDFSPGK
ncbi:MAG TPA: hypothetical protein VGS22_17950 [Thermoanaerobaculia bacterium]|jgi:hypothetical protein|nr:hypothetical protein [Thermoanaerobaculia bacterium]